MPIADRSSMKALITKVVQYAKMHIHDEKQYVLFSNFVRLFYSHASENDLKRRSISELFGMAHSHWTLVCRQQKETIRQIRVFNPDVERDGWHTTHTVVELITKDMPFVVDSMRMEM